MINLDRAKLDPSSIFKSPADVLHEKSLSNADKIEILQRWAYDEREKAVAEEENMQGPEDSKGNLLDEILKSLLKLGVDDNPRPSPTKHG